MKLFLVVLLAAAIRAQPQEEVEKSAIKGLKLEPFNPAVVPTVYNHHPIHFNPVVYKATPEIKPIVAPVVKPVVYKTPEIKPVVYGVPEIKPVVYHTPEVKPFVYKAPVPVKFQPVVYKAPEIKPVVYKAPEIKPVIYKAPEIKPVIYKVPEIKPVVYKVPEIKPVVYHTPEIKPIVYKAPEVNPIVYKAPLVKPIVYKAPVVKPVVYKVPEIKPVVYHTPETKPIVYKTPEVKPIVYKVLEVKPIVYKSPAYPVPVAQPLPYAYQPVHTEVVEKEYEVPLKRVEYVAQPTGCKNVFGLDVPCKKAKREAEPQHLVYNAPATAYHHHPLVYTHQPAAAAVYKALPPKIQKVEVAKPVFKEYVHQIPLLPSCTNGFGMPVPCKDNF